MRNVSKLFIAAVIAFGGAVTLIGCHDDADYDRHDDGGSYSRKTTVERDRDGDRTVKTEVRHTD